MQGPAIGEIEPERARRTLSGGVLIYRWVAYLWMLGLNVLSPGPFRRPILAWSGLAAAGALTVYMTLHRHRGRRDPLALLVVDLALSTALIMMSGLVVGPTQVHVGNRLFYATAYPLSTALLWGATYGPIGALVSAGVLGTALVFSRPLNGVPLSTLSAAQILQLGNGVVTFLLAAGVAGAVARHLDRSTDQLRAAMDDAMRSREHAARLDQHRSIARTIHDSVLQVLALIHKRGLELAAHPPIPPDEMRRLAEMAGREEQELRTLILREPEDTPVGTESLRARLEAEARATTGVPVTVNALGAVFVPASVADALTSAVHQALDNVVEHAEASRAAVFAEIEDGWVVVSIRDDGKGFRYSEEQLRVEGKAGVLGSMKGRIEDLGGRMRILTAPGAGTEVEFRVPSEAKARTMVRAERVPA